MIKVVFCRHRSCDDESSGPGGSGSLGQKTVTFVPQMKQALHTVKPIKLEWKVLTAEDLLSDWPPTASKAPYAAM